MEHINQYSVGKKTVTHKGKILTVSDNNKIFDYIKTLEGNPVQLVKVPTGLEHRPDNISGAFYNTPTKDWIILMINNIKDPFQQLNNGDILIIPKI